MHTSQQTESSQGTGSLRRHCLPKVRRLRTDSVNCVQARRAASCGIKLAGSCQAPTSLQLLRQAPPLPARLVYMGLQGSCYHRKGGGSHNLGQGGLHGQALWNQRFRADVTGAQVKAQTTCCRGRGRAICRQLQGSCHKSRSDPYCKAARPHQAAPSLCGLKAGCSWGTAAADGWITTGWPTATIAIITLSWSPRGGAHVTAGAHVSSASNCQHSSMA